VAPLPPGITGDPGLFGPGSLYWQVNRERVLVLGTPAIALLQVAHPLVAAAVAEHTDFARGPIERLRSTLGTTLTVVFGDSEQAGAAAGRVRSLHAAIHGEVDEGSNAFPAGTPYDATDQDLLLWAHVTVVRGALDLFHRFVRPLTPAERERYVQEAERFGVAFGIRPEVLPKNAFELESRFRSMVEGGSLEVGARARRLAEDVLTPPPGSARGTASLTRAVTAGLLPPAIGREFGLSWGTREQLTFRALAATSRATFRIIPKTARWWPHYWTARDRVRAI